MSDLTTADLDALPELARVIDAYNDVSEKRNGLWHSLRNRAAVVREAREVRPDSAARDLRGYRRGGAG